MNNFFKNHNLMGLETTMEKSTKEELIKYYCEFLRDSCEDDAEIRNLAMRVLPRIDVEGDSYEVPAITDIVKSLVIKIECLKTEINWIRYNKSWENTQTTK